MFKYTKKDEIYCNPEQYVWCCQNSFVFKSTANESCNAFQTKENWVPMTLQNFCPLRKNTIRFYAFPIFGVFLPFLHTSRLALQSLLT